MQGRGGRGFLRASLSFPQSALLPPRDSGGPVVQRGRRCNWGPVPVRGCVMDTQETGREHSAPRPRAEGRARQPVGWATLCPRRRCCPPPTDRDVNTQTHMREHTGTLKDTHPVVNGGHLWGGEVNGRELTVDVCSVPSESDVYRVTTPPPPALNQLRAHTPHPARPGAEQLTLQQSWAGPSLGSLGARDLSLSHLHVRKEGARPRLLSTLRAFNQHKAGTRRARPRGVTSETSLLLCPCHRTGPVLPPNSPKIPNIFLSKEINKQNQR